MAVIIDFLTKKALNLLIAVAYKPWLFRRLAAFMLSVLQKGTGYRSEVIETNLSKCLRDQLSPDQLHHLKRAYYEVLTRYVMETVSLAAYAAKKPARWIDLADAPRWQDWFGKRESILIMSSHYGNWEVVIPLLPTILQMDVVAFYKPVKNKTIDQWVKQSRGKFGLDLQPIEHTARVMAARRLGKTAYVFLSDQSPVNLNGAYWNTFLTQETPWLTGAEKLAARYNIPVVYLRHLPTKQSPETLANLLTLSTPPVLYHCSFDLITEQPADMPTGQITEMYAKLLEEDIRREPVWWLWSHRRWKRAQKS